MTNDWLWDRTGVPDPEVARLEQALAPYRYAGRPLSALRRRRIPLAAAAAVLVAGAAAWLLSKSEPAPAGPGWAVAALEGTPRVGSRRVAEAAVLGVGEWLETDGASRARLEIPDLGHVQVGPASRLRLVESRSDAHRLALERGHLEASTWAPPRVFFVDTPAAVAADLGCRFTLDVADDGSGVLRVSSGSVSLEHAGRTSYVPRDAVCRTRRPVGPGTPHFADAPGALSDALARFDFDGAGPAALDVVLAEARPRDTLTLWHLLSRAGEADRARVHDRLATLVPPPADVTRAAVLALDPDALDRWRSALEGHW